jgi:miniconductance mechanosensitive channel
MAPNWYSTFMQILREAVRALMRYLGWSEAGSFYVESILLALMVLLLAILANWIARRVLLKVLHRIVRRTRTDWDDVLQEKRFFARLSHIAPAFVIYSSAGLFPEYSGFITNIAIAYMGLVGLLAVDALLNTVVSLYNRFDISRSRPIRGYVQALKAFIFVVGGIAILGTLIDESPWKLISGIGALTAIVLLVFKDSILGFVASIQVSANDMVRIGDWIEMPKFGADGDVVDITIQCVKVRNWDKTITTIPTYALVSDSFKNWRGMQDSGGRRIKRSVYIDMTSVKFCSPEMIERFKKFAFLGSHIEEKLAEIEQYNKEMGFDLSQKVNGRRLTNLGTFRAYMREYLRSHPRLHNGMTLLVRHRPPTEHGLPIEVYVFTNDIRWAEYEAIQADIFDHILAVIPEFELKVFQSPSGSDLKELSSLHEIPD